MAIRTALQKLAEQKPQQQEPQGACDRADRDGKAVFADLPFRLGDDPLSNEILREPYRDPLHSGASSYWIYLVFSP